MLPLSPKNAIGCKVIVHCIFKSEFAAKRIEKFDFQIGRINWT
jgi:hypothetical protein